MGRENCSMCDLVGNDIYCSYYDYAFYRCDQINHCPDGLDDDDDDFNGNEDYLGEDEEVW